MFAQLDFSKTFDMVSHYILAGKPWKCGIDDLTEMWIKNWLASRAQRAEISGTEYTWRPVANGVSQQLVLGLVFFNIFINDIIIGHQQSVKRSWNVKRKEENKKNTVLLRRMFFFLQMGSKQIDVVCLEIRQVKVNLNYKILRYYQRDNQNETIAAMIDPQLVYAHTLHG